MNEDIFVESKLFEAIYKHKKIFKKLVDQCKLIEQKKRFVVNQKGNILSIFSALISLITAAASMIAKSVLAVGRKYSSSRCNWQKIHNQ